MSEPKIEIIGATASNSKLSLELKEKSEMAFLLCKYIIWDTELTKGWIVTKWYKTYKNGTKYKIKPASSQKEFDDNVEEFLKLKDEINSHKDEDVMEIRSILREHLKGDKIE